MTTPVPAIERLQTKIDGLKITGLHIASGDMEGATLDSVAEELLHCLEYVESGKSVKLLVGDSQRTLFKGTPSKGILHCDDHGGHGFISDCRVCQAET